MCSQCDLGTTGSGNSSDYSVENLTVDKGLPNAWILKGMIRNTSSSAVVGAVKIKFLTASGDIVHSGRAFVNDNDAIQPGQAGPFDYAVSPDTYNGVVDYDIEFYER